jgi:1,4-dihydroxy-2-naphthoate octaprenyltransferase
MASSVREPNLASLGGSSPTRVLKRYFAATRPKFYAASLLPLLVGASLGFAGSERLDVLVVLLAVGAVLCLHGGANVLNDVADEASGNDGANSGRIHPYSGGSRFIQNGILDMARMRRLGLGLLAAAAVLGLLLTVHRGPGVVLFGLAGLALGVCYSLPPLRLSARGLGEGAVALAFGVLPVLGMYWLLTGRLDPHAAIVSLPISFWVTAILLINEVPDGRADGAVGRRTLVVRCGNRGARWIYLALQALAFAAIAWCALTGLLPIWSIILPGMLLAASWRAAAAIANADHDRRALRQGIELTLAIHGLGSVWLAGWIWLPAIFPGF